ncbi:MAG: HAD family hydrolase [Candidatus Acidiferrales bacterium]
MRMNPSLEILIPLAKNILSARKKNTLKISPRPRPSVIIFDVDGVLVGTRESYQRTVLQTVRFFTGHRPTFSELHAWKNRPGFNDDWKLSHAWVNSLGTSATFEDVKRKFIELYWGENGSGNVRKEKWLLPQANLRRLAKKAELAIFTGRVKWELDHTFGRLKMRRFFSKIVTVECVKEPKPSPEGLLQILDGRDPSIALYVGDNVDDALAAQSARMPFVAILPRGSEERRQRGARLLKLGALAMLSHASELEDWLKG